MRSLYASKETTWISQTSSILLVVRGGCCLVLKLRLLLLLSGVKCDVRKVCTISIWLDRWGRRHHVTPIEHNLVPVQVAVHRVLSDIVQGVILSLLVRQFFHQRLRLGDSRSAEPTSIKCSCMRRKLRTSHANQMLNMQLMVHLW